MTTVEAGAATIRDLFASSSPFFVGRNGTIEVETIFHWHYLRNVDALPQTYPPHIRQQIERNAGIFPSTDESIDAWCEAYVAALGHLEGAAVGWYKPQEAAEQIIMKTYSSEEAFGCPLRSLEPYYVESALRWTGALAGKSVAVVSSFAETMRKQLPKAAQIWKGIEGGGELLRGDVEWHFVKTGYSPILSLGVAAWPAGINSWELAVEHTVDEVMKSGATIALIGCGGLGMIIAGELKRRGVSALVLGGAIQVLFGIKGRRWVNHSVISSFWNDAWVWPAETEIPRGAVLVEGGCYW
jgi:hypothetical protein